ncbi:MAG TPA: GAF domain-containing protein, partial [Candidatus Limnocylindrales bacterium]|nr:GAF domain-containing protein [Candidatus Limnocylindrales bacterium]
MWSSTPAAATIAGALTMRTAGVLGGAAIRLGDGGSADGFAVTPIVWKEQVVGALVVAAQRTIDEADMKNIAGAAELVAVDLAEANVAWRAQRQAQDLEGRTRIVRELRRAQHARDLPGLLDRATQLVAEQFGADGVSIMLADQTGDLFVRSSRGLPEQYRHAKVAMGSGISGGVARSGQPTLLSGPVVGGTDEKVGESMVVPLRVSDRTLGVLCVEHRAPQQRYTQAHLDSLALIAQDIASIYLTTDEIISAESDRQQAIVLYELSRFATLGTDPSTDLLSATAMLAGTLRNDCVAIWQLENDRLRLRAATGYDAEPDAEFGPEESDTTLATVLREKKSARTEIKSTADRPVWADPTCTRFLLTPIGTQGVLIMSRATEPYTDAEVEFNTTVAEYLVAMLQKSQAQDVVDRGVSAERRRIAQELHDGLAQELTGVVLALEGFQRAFEKDPTLLAPQLQKASRDARATLADVRQYMAALRQSETGALNLPVTLARLVDDLRRQT